MLWFMRAFCSRSRPAFCSRSSHKNSAPMMVRKSLAHPAGSPNSMCFHEGSMPFRFVMATLMTSLATEGQRRKEMESAADQEMATADVISSDAFVMPTSNSFGQTFRLYDAESKRKASVEDFYRINHINQTYSFALDMREKHLKLNKRVMSIWECCELLNEYVDESDPDTDEPQIEHLLQTAEAIRRDHPNEDWFHITGLIHDLGKVLLHPAFGEQPQWAVVGDTFPLGCAFDNAVVHSKYFKENPDYNDPHYTTKYGIYEEGCGLDKLIMSWGHDEYMYQVIKQNNTTLPPQALFIIRYHSFYSLHQGGAYTHFLNDTDRKMMPWLKTFQKYDLYSKSKVCVDVEKVKPYYLSLIEKYFPKTLRW